MTAQAKIETRKATMRHTATLEAMLSRRHSESHLGMNLAGDVEMIMEAGLSAEVMCTELAKVVAVFRDESAVIKAGFMLFGAKIDAMSFADHS